MNSSTGAIATFLLVAVVGSFSITTFSLFDSSRKYTTTAAVFEQAFGYDEIFGAEQDLNIAVGLDGVASKDFQSNGLLRPDYGELKVSVHEWYANGNYTTHSIKTHLCTAEELGLPPLAEVKEEAPTALEVARAYIKYDDFKDEPLLK